MLEGRVFVAHNARFDYSFLSAEFERLRRIFTAKVLCSLMLSRRLCPELARHDLDSLGEYHGLRIEDRHRALPDADLLWRWWQAPHRRVSAVTIDRAIANLLAGPVLPAQLNISLIDRLPRGPGAYVFHGEGREPLVVGAANNLGQYVTQCFRIDQASTKALEHAHRITDVTWHATRGPLGARLRAAELDKVLLAGPSPRSNTPQFTWRMAPDAVLCIAVVPIDEALGEKAEAFGFFPTLRKANNALLRFATKHRLCHCLLGVCQRTGASCAIVDRHRPAGCAQSQGWKKELLRVFEALQPMRIPVWPHDGPLGTRERSDMHVVDQWQYLGTARTESDIHELLQSGPIAFDTRSYRLLRQSLAQMRPANMVDLRPLVGTGRKRPPYAAPHGTPKPLGAQLVDWSETRK